MSFHLPYHGGPAPVCRYWLRGLCMNGIQCQDRHSVEGVTVRPFLGEAFNPQPSRSRAPLEEVSIPISMRQFDVFSPGSDMERVRINQQPPTYEMDDFKIWEDEVEESVDQHLPNATIPEEFDFAIWEDNDGAFAQEEEELDHDVMDFEMSENQENQGNRTHELASHERQYRQNRVLVEIYPDDAGVYNAELLEGQENTSPGSEVSVFDHALATTRATSSSQHELFSSSPTTLNSFDMNQARDNSQNDRGEGNGPHPSFIQVANPYIFEQKLQDCLIALGASEHKEDSIRLQGVHWIDSVRKALQLPVRTFNTAVVYYHKFRLVHADNEYMFIDAAAAALFTACKIEDTLKKSREVLCAAYNMKVSMSDHLSQDDPLFDGPSKTVVGLERLMLESAGFDFRNRHPQEIVVKLIRDFDLPKDIIGKMAYNMSIDIYRTFAPLKQTAQAMAIACIELAARLLNLTTGFDLSPVLGPNGISLEKSSTTRAEVMETLLDLLDLYTHHRNATFIGPQFSIDNFINVRISLNKEASSADIARYTEHSEAKKLAPSSSASNGISSNGAAAAAAAKHSPISPAADHNPSPHSPPAMGPTSATGAKSRVGERGKDGTVRFMLSAERANGEKETVAKYFAADEWVEYEEEMDVPI